MIEDSNYYFVQAVLRKDRWVVPVCPFCGKTHRHAAGTSDGGNPRDHLGDRVSHCHQGDYFLVEWRDDGKSVPANAQAKIAKSIEALAQWEKDLRGHKTGEPFPAYGSVCRRSLKLDCDSRYEYGGKVVLVCNEIWNRSLSCRLSRCLLVAEWVVAVFV
ncbi:MAG: hypothetical protein ACR2HJ_12755 [Fimbriimonadales bacterium]